MSSSNVIIGLLAVVAIIAIYGVVRVEKLSINTNAGGQMGFSAPSVGVWGDDTNATHVGTLQTTVNVDTWNPVVDPSQKLSVVFPPDPNYLSLDTVSNRFTVSKSGLYIVNYNIQHSNPDQGYTIAFAVQDKSGNIVSGSRQRSLFPLTNRQNANVSNQFLVNAKSGDTFQLVSRCLNSGIAEQKMYVGDLSFSMVFIRPM